MSPLKKIILIFVLFLVCLYFSINNEIKLGLDLAGGSQLVFEADTSKISSDKKNSSLESLRNVIERRVNLFGISEPNVQTSNFEEKDRIVVELPGINDTKEAQALIGKTAQLVFAEVIEIPGKDGATPSASLKPTDLTGADLAESGVDFDQNTGKPAVSLTFTKEGGDKFAKITGDNVGKPVAIILDNEVVSAPNVQEKIVGGTAQITGSFTLDEAKKLSIQLNAGALPVPVRVVEERTIGATLGAESISKSIVAGLVGLGMVMLFMIISYKGLGLVADIGLIVFGVITLALYKLIPVVLTLPGIAGFLLSVGMAVDSNILIFERFKEEKDKHSTISDALEVDMWELFDFGHEVSPKELRDLIKRLANELDEDKLKTICQDWQSSLLSY